LQAARATEAKHGIGITGEQPRGDEMNLKEATIATAPTCLNMSDKAMWVLGYNEAIKAAKWIPVSDRLPEKNTEVLVAFKGISIASTGQYTGHPRDTEGWCYPRENDGMADDGTDPIVSHWMNLPDTPYFIKNQGPKSE
jgi:hypothetical protein